MKKTETQIIAISDKGSMIRFEDELHRHYLINSIRSLSVELIKIVGVKDPDEMWLNICDVAGTQSFPFFKYRMEFLLENGVYYWDASKIKKLQGIEIKDLIFIEVLIDKMKRIPKVSGDAASQGFEVFLFCSLEFKQS